MRLKAAFVNRLEGASSKNFYAEIAEGKESEYASDSRTIARLAGIWATVEREVATGASHFIHRDQSGHASLRLSGHDRWGGR
jgi:hypothetical protein